MTRTTQVQRAVTQELEKVRLLLDANVPIEAVSIFVTLTKTGKPLRIVIKPEVQSDLKDS